MSNAAPDNFNAADHQLRYLASLVKARVGVPDVAARFGFDYSVTGRLPCPACHEQSTTKQTVALYDDGARWHCFRCNDGGDVVNWLAARLDTSKRDAIHRLCSILCISPDDDSLVAYLKGTLTLKSVDLASRGKVASALRELRRRRSKRLAFELPLTFDQHGRVDNLAALARTVAFFQFAAVTAHRGNADHALRETERTTLDIRRVAPSALLDAVDLVAETYEAGLQSLAMHVAAVEYLRSRRFTGDLLRRFGAGLVNADRVEYGPADTKVADALIEAGVFYAAPPRHAMKGRLVFPFRAADGTPVAFAGRSFNNLNPKWMNTSDSGIFSKRCFLFGLDVALPRMLETGRVAVVEGYSDCLAVNAAGEACVATAGTSLTLEHVDSLRGLVSDVVLLFDGDDAGRTASMRAALSLRGHVPAIREAVLSEGVDPDQLPPESIRSIIAQAAPVARTETAEEWAAAMRRRLD